MIAPYTFMVPTAMTSIVHSTSFHLNLKDHHSFEALKHLLLLSLLFSIFEELQLILKAIGNNYLPTPT